MHRLGLCGTECIQGSRVGLGRNESRAQQSFETPNDAAEDRHHVVAGGRRQLDEAHAAVPPHEHAVRDDAVKVHVEVQRPAKALDEGDRASVTTTTGTYGHLSLEDLRDAMARIGPKNPAPFADEDAASTSPPGFAERESRLPE